MKRILGILVIAALATPAAQPAAPQPQRKASDTPKAAFIKKCFRDRTKASCTAPAAARAKN